MFYDAAKRDHGLAQHVLVTAVGQHFIEWNVPVVARFFSDVDD